MAGLQSQNISVASTKLPGPSTLDKDVCVFCHRRATPPASDPHAPLFPFFSLVDCRHYACQPCALVHCDNAGRHIDCPQCHCTSRLAQSGRRRNRSSSARDGGVGADGNSVAGGSHRVFIDDGVSSVRSHRSATARASPHRSALKGQSGSAKKRSSSVQFPANPTTSIVDDDAGAAASLASAGRPAEGEDGSGGEGRRATSPLTQDAVAALPVDPTEVRRQRVRDQQQRRAAAAAAQAEKSVSLYAITAAPPKPVTATMSGDAAGRPSRRSKDRSHSQPVPKLPNTILEPKQVFPLPPPLVLHTVDEDEAAPAVDAKAAVGESSTTTATAGTDTVHAESATVSISRPSATAQQGHDDDDNSLRATQTDEVSTIVHGTAEADTTAVAAPLSPLHRAQLDDCAAAETEERVMLDAVEEHDRAKLRQRMEEAETTIYARRGLEGEFASTPAPTQPDGALTDMSDQVSATSDDDLSQRSSAYKYGSAGSSRRKHRSTPRNSVADSEQAAAATKGDVEGQKPVDASQLRSAETPANALSTARAAAGATGTASAVDTPSPMTAARASRPGEVDNEHLDGFTQPSRVEDPTTLPSAEENASAIEAIVAAESAARAAAEAEEERAAREAHAREQRERAAQEEERAFFERQRDRLFQLEQRARDQLVRDATEEERALRAEQRRVFDLELRAQEQRARAAEEEKQLFAQQQGRLLELERRARYQMECDADDDTALLQQQHDRELQLLRRAAELREREAEDESRERQQQQMDRRTQQQQRDALARRTLEEQETLERDALQQSEAAVRTHYERNAAEWRDALMSSEVDAQQLARAAAAVARQQQDQQQRQQLLHEMLSWEVRDRASVSDDEADEWSWIVSGARVDRVLAATEEGERVQREYEEIRYERLLQQFRQDVAALVEEEHRGRVAFQQYEAATRNVLQSHYTVQQNVAAAEEERQQREAAQRAAARRRDAALQLRWQRACDELDADEAETRAVIREEEREERRTANIVFVQAAAAARRRELLASLAESARRSEEAAETAEAAAGRAPADSSVFSDVPTVSASETHRAVQADSPPAPRDRNDVAEASRVSAEQLEELRARQAQYEEDMRAALSRLQEAERRVAEEAAIRARAEQERLASQAESDRLLREAERRAEQRIHDARDAAERLMQAQLADVRDEAARRAEHAALMQSLAEEEQRAVLEAKLQAAERQLQQAEQRAQEEVRRAREEAAQMAAAEAARAAREAQRRDEEWQEHARAEKALRLAERESEKEDALRRLRDIEERAAAAVQQAREEAARNAAAMEERMAEMELRQLAREAELQMAAQRVRSARDSMRDFDSCSPSSQHTSPSRRGLLHASPSQQLPPHGQSGSHTSSLHGVVSIMTTPSRSDRLLASPASVPSNAAQQQQQQLSASAASRTSAQTPPLAPPSAAERNAARNAAAGGGGSASTPPRVMLSAGAVETPLSSAQATALSRQQPPPQPVPSSAASASGGALWPFDPAEVVRAAIREAVMEIVAAQQRAQSLQDQAEQHVELSERRFHRRVSDHQQAAQDVADLESSRQQSEAADSPASVIEAAHPRTTSSRRRSAAEVKDAHGRTRPRGQADARDAFASSRASDSTPSPSSEQQQQQHRRDESPWSRSPMSSPGAAAGAAVPVSSASAAVPASVMSTAISNTSSVYFDDQPYWTAGDARATTASAAAAAVAAAAARGQYRYEPMASWQRQPYATTNAAPSQPSQPASRVLFPSSSQHYGTTAAAAAEEERQHHSAGASAQPRQPTAPAHGASHAYNEPEPRMPTSSATLEYSPPPRRSTTRAATESEPARASNTASTAFTGVGALPQPSRVCPRCYREDTTSPCWRCGEMICRHCGLRPDSARKLCCTAHLRAQLREHARRKAYESGSAGPAAHPEAVGEMMENDAPRYQRSDANVQHQPQRQQQQQQQRVPPPPRRGDQQVQTSFKTSTNASETGNAANYRDQRRMREEEEVVVEEDSEYGYSADDVYTDDAEPSAYGPQEPMSMIPPSAYYRPPPPRAAHAVRPPRHHPQQQQQPQPQHPQQQYYFDHPGQYSNPVSIAAMTAMDPYTFPAVNPPQVPYGYANPYASTQPAWGWQPHVMPGMMPPVAQPPMTVPAMPPPQPQVYAAPQVPVSVVQQQQQQQPQATQRVSPPPAAPAPPQQPQAESVPLISSSQVPPPLPPAPAAAQPPSAARRPVDVLVEDDDVSHMSQPTSHVARRPSSAEPVVKESHNAAAVVPSSATSQPPSSSLPPPPAQTADGVAMGNANAAAQAPASSLPQKEVRGAGEEKLMATPNGSDSSPPEPKTERKPAASAFFVALEGGAEEPRRPKPPTPCNYVPSKMFPPDAMRAAATAAINKPRKASTSPSGWPQYGVHHRANASNGKIGDGGLRKGSPAVRKAVPHPALHDPYAAAPARDQRARPQTTVSPTAVLSSQPPPRRSSPSPYAASSHQYARQQGPPGMRTTSPRTQAELPEARQPAMVAHMRAVAPMHPRFAEVRKEAAAAPTASRQQSAPAQPQPRRRSESESSDSYSSYTTSTSSVGGAAKAREPQKWPVQGGDAQDRLRPSQSAAPHDAHARRAGEPSSHAHGQLPSSSVSRPRQTPPAVDTYQPSSAQPRSYGGGHYDPYTRSGVDTDGQLPQRPRLQQHQQQQPSSRDEDPSYISYASRSTVTQRDGNAERAEPVAPHRYAPHAERRVPTLAELDRRLQQLREQDEYEAAQYQQRQSRIWQSAVPQYDHPAPSHQYGSSSVPPQVHVLLQSPGGAPRSGQRHPSNGATRHRHGSRSRSPQQRTVSPPWRTDLNTSPLRPRWDISQPHSPIYHPPTTTTAGQ